MREIRLYGALGREFGTTFHFDVETIADAIAAFRANFPTFANFIRERHFRVIVGENTKNGIALEEADLPGFKLGKQSLHIVPTIKGRKRGGLGKIIAGIALVGLSIFTGGLGGLWTAGLFGSTTTISGMFGSIGVGMAIAGVAQLIAPEQKDDDKQQSFTMSGPVSNAREGSIVPIAYGEVITGGVLINGALNIVSKEKNSSSESDPNGDFFGGGVFGPFLGPRTPAGDFGSQS